MSLVVGKWPNEKLEADGEMEVVVLVVVASLSVLAVERDVNGGERAVEVVVSGEIGT